MKESTVEQGQIKKFARTKGEVYVWLCSMGLAVGLVMVIGLLALIVGQGLNVFWPKPIAQFQLKEGSAFLMGDKPFVGGEITRKQAKRGLDHDAEPEYEWQLFTANRDTYGASFKYVDAADVLGISYPGDLMILERMEYGDAIGYPVSLTLPSGEVIPFDAPEFQASLHRSVQEVEKRRRKIEHLEKNQIGRINSAMNSIRLQKRAMQRSGVEDADLLAGWKERQKQLEIDYEKLAAEARSLREQQQQGSLTLRLISGQERSIPLGEIVHYLYPNELGFFEKLGDFARNFWSFLSENPREANTEGGIFPAIFGTAVMTLIMSIVVMPFGVIAAIYLREYAVQGFLVRSVRIAVNNLAGVPSIVFGVFGLGFFVYLAGGTLDQLLFSDTLPTPTFGTGGIFWASLTLALMTVPVVIVATEEALAAVPRGVREGSLACGASKWQTIQRIVLPASAPGILTGLILAMARGAGEVAPLMLVGVVKLAPSLPVDGEFPFFHLERKFMHLGFHIYDLGFQSPDAEAAKPMVFATTLLLILLVVVLNLAAIIIRERLRKKYATSIF